ncbi:putative transcription factor PosF21 [Sesamum angolense]|uniref:Transcription factor PosF21 n=1 Tax=Sesamum angolense TaxID=2727404 RepID=A0AAE1W6Y3_9LAMI|nr:putative transcription factor PosF21 [Sesamum angolense]
MVLGVYYLHQGGTLLSLHPIVVTNEVRAIRIIQFALVGAGILSEQDHFGHGMSDSSRFSHDISQMPDNPPKNLGHRRAHSEILTLPDDISFDSDLAKQGSSSTPAIESSNPSADNVATASNEKPRIRHQHSQSMDGSTTIKPEMLMSGSEGPSPAETKKAISAAKLAELALMIQSVLRVMHTCLVTYHAALSLAESGLYSIFRI